MQLIEREFGVKLSIRATGEYLRRWGFTPQKPTWFETKLSMANDPFGRGLAAADVDDEPNDEVGEVEAMVEAVGERAEVAFGVLGVAEGLVGARQHGLEVAQHGVDPLELRQIPGLALADDFDLVDAAGLGDGSKAAQAITVCEL